MKAPNSMPASKGGGGTNMTRNPPASADVPFKGTMGSGQASQVARGTMGSMNGNPSTKGVQGRDI